MATMKLGLEFCSTMSGFWNRRFVVVLVSFLFAMLFIMLSFCLDGSRLLISDGGNIRGTTLHRRLLTLTRGSIMEERKRILAWKKCRKRDIVVSQGATRPLPNGIPTYTVDITNVCAHGCDISDIHLSCGWFSSARLIAPNIFKRIAYNDCLVNGGKALKHGRSLSFQYATTFSYPLSVSSLTCSS